MIQVKTYVIGDEEAKKLGTADRLDDVFTKEFMAIAQPFLDHEGEVISIDIVIQPRKERK